MFLHQRPETKGEYQPAQTPDRQGRTWIAGLPLCPALIPLLLRFDSHNAILLFVISSIRMWRGRIQTSLYAALSSLFVMSRRDARRNWNRVDQKIRRLIHWYFQIPVTKCTQKLYIMRLQSKSKLWRKIAYFTKTADDTNSARDLTSFTSRTTYRSIQSLIFDSCCRECRHASPRLNEIQ